jgi:hypothetical protein
LDAASGAPQILRYNTDGSFDQAIHQYFGLDAFQPNDLQFGNDGDLYVSGIDLNLGAGEILRYKPDGTPDGLSGAVLINTGLTYPTFLAFGNSVPEPSTAVVIGAMSFAGLLRRSRGRRH